MWWYVFVSIKSYNAPNPYISSVLVFRFTCLLHYIHIPFLSFRWANITYCSHHDGSCVPRFGSKSSFSGFRYCHTIFALLLVNTCCMHEIAWGNISLNYPMAFSFLLIYYWQSEITQMSSKVGCFTRWHSQFSLTAHDKICWFPYFHRWSVVNQVIIGRSDQASANQAWKATTTMWFATMHEVNTIIHGASCINLSNVYVFENEMF